jgi:hypothetical protein
MLSIIATVVGFVVYMTQLKVTDGVALLDMAFMFGIGYTCESFFNKYEPAAKQ